MKIEIDRNDERKLFEAYYCLDTMLNGKDKLSRSALYQENKQLKEQLAEKDKQLEIYKEALKLACGKKGDTFKCPCICEIGDFNQCYNCKYKHYIEQAKESIK